MLKKAILILLLLFLTLPLFSISFSFGGNLGPNYAIISTKTIWDGTSYVGGPGFDISFVGEVEFFPFLSLSLGMKYIMKSYFYTKTYEGDIVDNIFISNHFFEFPLTIRYVFEKDKFGGFIGAGGYIGVRFVEVYSGFSTNLLVGETYIKTVPFDSSDNLYDAGIIVEAGGYYKAYGGKLLLTITYQYSLTSLHNDTQVNTIHTYLDTISLSFGYQYSFGNKQ